MQGSRVLGLVLLGLVSYLIITGYGVYPSVPALPVSSNTSTLTRSVSVMSITQNGNLVTISANTTYPQTCIYGPVCQPVQIYPNISPITSVQDYCLRYQQYFGVSYCPIASTASNTAFSLIQLAAVLPNAPVIDSRLLIGVAIGLLLIIFANRGGK